MAQPPSDQDIDIGALTAELINCAPDRIHIIDPDGQILFANRQDTQPAEPRRAAGSNLFDFVHPEYQDLARGVCHTVRTSGSPGSFECFLHFGHTEQWFQTCVIPLQMQETGEEGQKSGLLALFHREAGPSWAAHEAIRQRTDALEKRLAERNQTLEAYTRYVDAGGKLNIQLTRLNSVSVVLQTLAEHVKTAMNCQFSAIYHIHKDWIEFAAGVQSPILHHRKESLDENGILGQLLQKNDIQFFPQFNETTALQIWRGFPHEVDLQALLVVPVVCSNAFQGILYLGYDHPARFDKNDAHVLRAFIEATIDTLHRIHLVNKLERNILTREMEIAVLYDLSTYASEPVGLEVMLQKSVRRLMAATGCIAGIMFWIEPDGAHTDTVTCWPPTGIPEPVKVFLREGRPPARTEQSGSYSLHPLPPSNSIACMTIPIQSKGKPGCFLRLFGDSENLQHPEIIHLILSAARQMGLSIDSALDHQKAQAAVVLEERQRMARNLHDSITQSLYALNLSSDVALKAFDRNEGHRLRPALEDVNASSLQALKEMRLMLFELRPAALEKAGLIDAIQLRLNTVERRSGMEAHLEHTGELDIPDTMEVELYSMICEALNNSLRHSGARCVWVRIRAAAHMISVEVEDNGTGFEVESVRQGGMGLTSMNERARKLGGSLTVSSSARLGTRISIKIRVQGEF